MGVLARAGDDQLAQMLFEALLELGKVCVSGKGAADRLGFRIEGQLVQKLLKRFELPIGPFAHLPRRFDVLSDVARR